MIEDPVDVAEAFRSGADGYLSKGGIMMKSYLDCYVYPRGINI